MCSVFDNEEVGSGTKQGAGSTFGADVLKYNVAQKYTTDARSAAPEKAAYLVIDAVFLINSLDNI